MLLRTSYSRSSEDRKSEEAKVGQDDFEAVVDGDVLRPTSDGGADLWCLVVLDVVFDVDYDDEGTE
jgi:hypothetical protein